MFVTEQNRQCSLGFGLSLTSGVIGLVFETKTLVCGLNSFNGLSLSS